MPCPFATKKALSTASFLALLYSLVLFSGICSAWEGTVVRVVDGDTIVVSSRAGNVKVRLYGIDTPESAQYYGQNAKQFTSSQVLEKAVEVETIDRDRYGRTVGLVSVGDLVLNRLLVEYGYAWVYDRYCKRSFCAEWKDL